MSSDSNATLRIGSRRSDLARLQTLMVADRLEEMGYKVECEYQEAPGDTNLKDPLWKMPETGVFTTFLRQKLLDGSVDLVVHSWKDLPLAEEAGTTVAATLPRADPRDLIIIRKDAEAEIRAMNGKLIVLSSSPRRQWNLPAFLQRAVPGVETVEFRDVRGNIQTRMRKLMDPARHDASLGPRPHALVLAKAAVDRFAQSHRGEFRNSRELVQGYLSKCHCMVLPLSANPTAAAQGALGVEVSTASEKGHVRKIVSKLNDEQTFQAAWREKEVLGAYGGGCHQRIGCTVLPRWYGKVGHLRGRTDGGVDLLRSEIIPTNAIDDSLRVDPGEHPLKVGGAGGLSLFTREEDTTAGERLLEALRGAGDGVGLWIAKSTALPNAPADLVEDINAMNIPVWVAGIPSWQHLAQRGLWCVGCTDGLGEIEDPDLKKSIAPSLRKWIKLTHTKAAEEQGNGHFDTAPDCEVEQLGTYTLVSKYEPRSCPEQLKSATYIFWGSGSAFTEARRLLPDLLDKVLVHGTGPGHTLETLLAAGVPRERIIVCLNYDEFERRIHRD
ncbi:porphobilinogen deaminase, putative [Perkinsus marinus ATCC 50983]|uniref:hydroxymethylbilane synthase n=1 Tax=Perkinsus marinus (strain ATCC 50983 / TXsc) TaxID=423536 RepID=C5KYY7_PERM5|nr:porphobilinogen deaminase, putative [Perkinsus marinus ATCC 50983]EER10306.1 porphobilinogen deaminase, putative [Perkinsus marinus ATCC 50983]|eukprot:XP_002778511.1 porphobilinogen deaminase, putative [Perkinsus marinus ATCC 50983]